MNKIVGVIVHLIFVFDPCFIFRHFEGCCGKESLSNL